MGQDSGQDAGQERPVDGLTVAAAARQLGITASALRKRLRRGTLPAFKVGEQWYLRREGVDAAGAADRATPPDRGSPSGSSRGTPTGRDTGRSPGTGPRRTAAYDVGRDGEMRRLEEQLALMHEEVEVRRRELHEEQDAHRREVQQLHTLLAQAQQLALPPPTASPEFHQASQDTRQDSQDERQDERQDATPQRRSWWKFW